MHVVHFEQGVVVRHRLLLEHIDGRGGDALRCERLDQRRLVHDRPARRVDEQRTRLHQPELARADQVLGLVAEQAVDGDDVGFPQQRVEVHHLDAQVRHRGLRNIRIVAQMHHVPWLGQAKHLLADVADADDAQHFAGQSVAEKIGFLFPASVARESILGRQAVRHRQRKRHHAARHRPPHAIGRDGQQDPLLGAGGHVNRVVAHPEARHQFQATIGARDRLAAHARAEDAQRVVSAGVLGCQLGHCGGQVFPFDRRVVQNPQRGASIHGLAARAQYIACDADAEFFLRHSLLSPLRRRVPR